MKTEASTTPAGNSLPSVRPATATAGGAQAAGDPGKAGKAPVQEAATSGGPDLEKVVEQLNQAVQSVNRELNFRVDGSTGKTVITVTDSKTNEVIRQIPEQEVLETVENLRELQGLLLNTQA